MNESFAPSPVRPNLPLRKPSSSPLSCAPLRLSVPAALGGHGDALRVLLSSQVIGSPPPALTVYFCNFCGQQGNFRCKRCKTTPYCSVVCQTEDWMAHRHMCKSVEPDPQVTATDQLGHIFWDQGYPFLLHYVACEAKQSLTRALFEMANNLAALCKYTDKPTAIKADRDVVSIAVLRGGLSDGSLDTVCNTSVNPLSSTVVIGLHFIAINLARIETPKKATSSPVMKVKASPLELKPAQSSTSQRILLKDLQMTKIAKWADFQASVVEFYNPSRFFLLAQNPEVLESLQSISAELQKTYNNASGVTYVPCVGEVCAVQFSLDLNWYRGLIQNVGANQKTANVLYIDFGNQEEAPVERIRPLAANIPSFCPCAMECRVAGVRPVAGDWSGECDIAMRRLLVGKTVTVRLLEMTKNSHTYAVDILLSMGNHLSAFLIEHGYAQAEVINVAPTEQEINAMVSTSLENFKRHSNGKDDNTWAQPPEPLTQALGDSFPVVVTHFQSPTDIIVQKVDNAGVIQKLQLELREHCSQGPAPKNFRPAPGTVCCAQFSEDKQWYRAKVLAYSADQRVCVGYLDFGNSEEVDLGDLLPISTSLLALPMQAVPCGLAGVNPVGESWSEECLQALQRRVSNRILHALIQGAHDGKALVIMTDEASDPQANIAELLISAGYAVPAPFPSSVNTSGDQQVELTSTVTAEPQVNEPLVWSSAELPIDGHMVSLLASVVVSPGEFFCRIDCSKDYQQLMELGAELKLHCQADSSAFVAKVGEPCCAVFPGNGTWCRAMVQEQSENIVAVNFVDYGYSIRVDKSHLRSITPQLLKLPFQAIRCWLTGVEPLGSEWSSEALLWFQTLVEGQPLSARVHSITEQGYGVELESRGQNVAGSLISEHLAKVAGETLTETHASTTSKDKCQESKLGQMQFQATCQTGTSDEKVAMELTAASAPSFPVDWKTVELPIKETFQPFIAAVISPSLFFLLDPNQVDQQKLQEVKMELAVHCSNNQPSLSSAGLAPGAACCAQFSADNNWYRAVVLEVRKSEARVIYADYGNTETVPISRILPIPPNLLQVPFLISRCSLAGKEHFPTEWPVQVQQLFQSLELNRVVGTVQSFDGSANILSLTLLPQQGGGGLTTLILDALQAQSMSNTCPSAKMTPDHADNSTSSTSTTAAPECPQPQSTPANRKSQENPTATIIPPEPTPQTPQERTNTPESLNSDPVQRIIAQMEPPCILNPTANVFDLKDLLPSLCSRPDPQSSRCCCLSLKTKIDHLEELMQLQLSLINQFVGQKS
ncbi:tudor domain-containing protein 1 [Aulostomus maculatus]